MGVLTGFSYTEKTYKMKPEDRLVVFTDGISEARAEGNILFGNQGVIDYLLEHHDINPLEMITGLIEAATKHAGGQLQDDVAIMVITL
jgi:serine phosphatase RsbU (regulator of sigma subunit)